MLENIVTLINDQVYYGWKNFRMSSRLQQLYSDVSFSAVDNPELLNSLWLPQNTLTVLFDREVVFVGRIDQYSEYIESQSDNQVQHVTNIQGRSDASVMADSSYPDLTSVQLTQDNQLTLDAFLTKLTLPFELERRYEIIGDELTPVKYTKLSEYANVERELLNGLSTMQLRGATTTASKDGGFKIIFTDEYPEIGSISNIKKIELKVNETNRYYRYEVTNQNVSSTIDTGSASSAPTITESIDESVDQDKRIKRVKFAGDGNSSQEYAHWLNNTHYAKSRQISLTIVGFRNDDGVLYEPGQIVRLEGNIYDRSKASSIESWLIESVTYKQNHDQSGSICNLNLIHPDAYITRPATPPRSNNNRIL